YLPTFRVEEVARVPHPDYKTKVTFTGIGLFQDDKLVKYLKKEALGLMLTANQLPHPVVKVLAPEGDGYLTVRLIQYRTDISTITGGLGPRFRIRISGEFALLEN